MEPRSHPSEDGRDEVLLKDHLTDVADRAMYLTPSDAETPSGESLAEVVRTLGYVHDFGKATTYFQSYLVDGDGPEDDRRRYHAPIGAFVAYAALDAQGFDTETCLAGFVAVGKHHGVLPDIAAYVHKRAHRAHDDPAQQTTAERLQNVLAEQLQNIRNENPAFAERIFERATRGAGNWEAFSVGDFSETLATVAEPVEGLPSVNPTRERLSESCYELALQCWSTLVLADKTGAARGPEDEMEYDDLYRARKPDSRALAAYIDGLEADANGDPEGTQSERLDFHRSRARDEVLSRTDEFAESDSGVATLTLPTGLGKTLTGLSAAMRLRNRSDGERIVYALPFTSVIDQVVDEITDVYGASGRLLTAHHHLAETTLRDDDGADADTADLNDDLAGTLAESWRAGLTVTTFVQLFESLAGPQNHQSMKLPALWNSVVILDEPQSLPIDWWKLAPRLARILVERYDATVIAMTATQPRLFAETDELDPVELVPDSDSYFEAFERVEYQLDPSVERYLADGHHAEPKDYDDAAAELRRAIEAGEPTLAVCNTIDSARELTKKVTDEANPLDVADRYAERLKQGDVDSEALANEVKRADGWALLHLSTRLRPKDRLTLVETAKQLADDGFPLLVVSTQLVEAGVDISFERVYRDLAPMDSVVQAAGRCNRNFERERGSVTVWWLEAPNEQAKTPAEAVYNRGASLLPETAKALDSAREDELTETAVARDAVDEYYHRLREDRNVGKQAYADWVDDARGDKLGNLSLIDERRAADVLVCRTKAERELANAFATARHTRNFDRLRELRDETKPLRVSVPYYREDSEAAEKIRDLPVLDEDMGLYLLDTTQQGEYFHSRDGVVLPDDTVEARFL